MDGGNRKCGGESQENNSLEVIRGIEERISPATQSRNWWGPWSSASVHQNLCAFISTCAPIQTPVPQSRPLKSYANLCTLHLSLPICSQTCTCTLSAEFFPLAPALLMQIHYTGMARGPRWAGKRFRGSLVPGWGHAAALNQSQCKAITSTSTSHTCAQRFNICSSEAAKIAIRIGILFVSQEL